MANKYNEVENRTVTIQRKTKTLSFRPSIEAVDVKQFMQFVTGKVSMNLYDFTAGKGDDAFNICFNFDLQDVEYLYEHAKLSSLQIPYQATKFLGAYPETKGKHSGMAKNTKIVIKRDPFIKDKETGEKKIAPNPWLISLEVGWAKPAKNDMGMFFPKKGTYEKENASFIALTDIEFLMCFSKCCHFIDEMRRLVAPELLEKGFEALSRQNERGSYMEEETSDTSDQHTVEVMLLKLERSEDGVISAVGLIKDKKYSLILDSFGEAHKDAYKNQKPISLQMYQKDGKLHCA